jgi:hypothetical protein
MNRLSYQTLQNQWGGKFVILNKEETTVLIAEENAEKAMEILKQRKISKTDVVFAGFIPKEGTVRI